MSTTATRYQPGTKPPIRQKPWGVSDIFGPPSKPQLHLYIQTLCDRYPWLCQDTYPVDADGFPPDPWELTALVTMASLIGHDGYPNPDGTGPDPDGPIGPIMHDILVALAAGQLAADMVDRELGYELQAIAGKAAQVNVARLRALI